MKAGESCWRGGEGGEIDGACAGGLKWSLGPSGSGGWTLNQEGTFHSYAAPRPPDPGSFVSRAAFDRQQDAKQQWRAGLVWRSTSLCRYNMQENRSPDPRLVIHHCNTHITASLTSNKCTDMDMCTLWRSGLVVSDCTYLDLLHTYRPDMLLSTAELLNPIPFLKWCVSNFRCHHVRCFNWPFLSSCSRDQMCLFYNHIKNLCHPVNWSLK